MTPEPGSRQTQEPSDGSVTHQPRWVGLSLLALGVVYGDIGTSPLYALRECFHGAHGIAVTSSNVFGVLSLVFWALVLVVSTKYLCFILRADNRGEGGILALMALATPVHLIPTSERRWRVMLGIIGAALLYGDGVITPAISVLGAVEGLSVATHVFEPVVVPITVVVLLGLFAIQSRGAGSVGRLFAPVMIAWFATIAMLGIAGIVSHPAIVASISPHYAIEFLMTNHWHGFLVLGSVFLVVTGGEALYADMGYFGKSPIRYSWFLVVFPALLLNYLGQGALMVMDPQAASNPFFRLAPQWFLYPLVILSTAAAVIASQALISGAFSLTMQASQLGLLPRMQIRHTSAFEYGQIYMPAINSMLMVGCILLVIGFRSSASLAAAYGIAVTATMAITTVLFYIVAREHWSWSRPAALSVALPFMVVDLAFLIANVTKIPDGGWLPIILGLGIFTIMTTWKQGRHLVALRLKERSHPTQDHLPEVLAHSLLRVPGTAVFMGSDDERIPPPLLQNIEHNKVLHEQVVLLTVKTAQSPYVDPDRRLEMKPLGNGCYRAIIRYGFMEDPDIPAALGQASQLGLNLDPANTTFFLGRDSILASERRPGMAVWRERLFARMAHNATSAAAYFCLPPDQVVELGTQVEI